MLDDLFHIPLKYFHPIKVFGVGEGFLVAELVLPLVEFGLEGVVDLEVGVD